MGHSIRWLYSYPWNPIGGTVLLPYLLVDAGSTLLFPDSALVCQVARKHGHNLPEDRVRRTMAEWVWEYDEAIRRGRDAAHFEAFLLWVLEHVGVPAEAAAPTAMELWKLDTDQSLWSVTFPWVHETLSALAGQGYRLSVISNADGRVEEGLQRVGLAGHFERIFDSHLVGYEKPDVRLFQQAVSQLGVLPARCLYVGDVYYIDVLGANRSGIAAVHLDPYGLYEGWPGYHIPNLAALPAFLSQHPNWQGEEFFPLRDDTPLRA